MRVIRGAKKNKAVAAQTLAFFALAFGTIILLCGLAIDSGLLFLAKARLSRAVDGAALAAVGNFHRSDDPQSNRDQVAVIMRNFAGANFTDLLGGPNGGISAGATGVQVPYTTSTGATAYTYTYNFNDGRTDANGQFKQFVKVVLTTGAGGEITTATCEARCPVHTYFIVLAGNYFRDLKVSSAAVATRNPRLIMVVIDRSASMLAPGGGAFGLPTAVVQFLDFFDTTADYIGIVSFGTNARLEMPLTTNFIYAGTNILVNSYEIDTNNSGNGITTAIPAPDQDIGTGVRRMKFGGQTAAADGIRLAMEQMMANTGFNDPNVVKYMVIFTDGKWNQTRTLVAAPGYTNTVYFPADLDLSTNMILPPTSATWGSNMALNYGIIPMPTLSPLPDVTNAIQQSDYIAEFAFGEGFGPIAANHTNDVWQSTDGAYEPLSDPMTTSTPVEGGTTPSITTNTYMGLTNIVQPDGTTNSFPLYTHNLDVWLPPGSVSYYYSSTNAINPVPTVSNYNFPDQHISVYLNPGESNVLVVPGYIADGTIYDGLDMGYYDDNSSTDGGPYPMYRMNNFDEAFMWPDDPVASSTDGTAMNSLDRQLMFRNYANLLTGYYVSRADDPLGTTIEPLTGALRPLYALGPYYPGSGMLWPFDFVGNDPWITYTLLDPNSPDPDPQYTQGFTDNAYPDGGSRHAEWTINMQSTNAAPQWAGEWFYEGTGGTNVISGTTAASTLMTSPSQWQAGAPQWILDDFNAAGEGIMTNEPSHNTILGAQGWRPVSYNGTPLSSGLSGVTPSGSITGGYVTDGNGNYFVNSMAYSGRPTHYFDFSTSKWKPITNNHITNVTFTGLNNWMAQEYAWHARAMGVTIYTVGYGTLVSPAEQVLLAQIANSTNTTAGNVQSWNGTTLSGYTPGPGTAMPYNVNQPIGQQYYATTVTDISNDFYQVGQAINSFLSQ